MKATHRYQNCMVSKRGTVVVLEEHVVKFYFEELHILIHFGLLECPFPVFLVSFGKGILSQDVPGQRSFSRDFCSCPCSGTKGQRDKEIFLARDNGSSHPGFSWDVPFLGNPTSILVKFIILHILTMLPVNTCDVVLFLS